MGEALATVDLELADFVGHYVDDPEGFVDHCFDWGNGSLLGQVGPDTWQREVLQEVGRQVRAHKFDGINAVDPIRIVVSSGHGIGKTTLIGFLVCWIMSTRPKCRVTLTANTMTQLSTKTWAGVRVWMERCITAHWFAVNTERATRIGDPGWFAQTQSSKESNSEAFAGQHAATSTSAFFFDEGSAIEDIIDTVAENGLTDGEPMFFVFGNPTRSVGRFFQHAFGGLQDGWKRWVIDSREARGGSGFRSDGTAG